MAGSREQRQGGLAVSQGFKQHEFMGGLSVVQVVGEQKRHFQRARGGGTASEGLCEHCGCPLSRKRKQGEGWDPGSQHWCSRIEQHPVQNHLTSHHDIQHRALLLGGWPHRGGVCEKPLAVSPTSHQRAPAFRHIRPSCYPIYLS